MADRAVELSAVTAKLSELTLRRNELIAALRSEGLSLRAIAELADMSHPAVLKILRR